MEYYFIYNPVSGTAKVRQEFLENIDKSGLKYKLIETSESGDAQKIVRDICMNRSDSQQSIRIFACGGDGTVSQVINGAYGFDNVEIGAIPLGTGNDFIRNFGDVSSYMDIKKYARSSSRECDLIKYRAITDGQVRDGFCVNMFNIGLDCNIVEMTGSVKKFPLISGSLAYLISVFVILIKREGANLKVIYDNGDVYNGRLMLISIANGCYCGGGIKGLPRAVTDDGFFDVSLIKYVTRREFLQLFPLYSKGVHLENSKVIAKDIIDYRHEKSLKIEAMDSFFKLCVDGEIFRCQSAEFAIDERAFRFIVPD